MSKFKSMFKILLPVTVFLLLSHQIMAIPEIHAAAREGRIADVKRLIKGGAYLDSMDQKYGETALGFAAIKGNLELAGLLLESGANVDAINIKKRTPLHLAAMEGQLEMARLLIKKGANLNAVSIRGWTPLHLAARNKQKALVKLLLENGALSGVKDRKGKTPLDYAKACNDASTISLLENNAKTK